MRNTLGSLAALLLLAFGSATALAAGHYSMAIASDNKQTMQEKAVFPPDAPKVYVIYMLSEVEKGAKLRAAWFAEKVEGQAENSKFDQAEITYSGTAGYAGVFSNPKPAKGNWPAGSYRVDLFINGALDKSVRFKVSK